MKHHAHRLDSRTMHYPHTPRIHILKRHPANLHSFSFFFFFQAEDGIRDYKVTGVQTCALPISLTAVTRMLARLVDVITLDGTVATDGFDDTTPIVCALCGVLPRRIVRLSCDPKIGRASCRERV